MTQEEKKLLLKDLCARLPYGVIVDYKESKFETPHWKITTIYPESFSGRIGYHERKGAGSESGSRPFEIGQYKPYLRPMSSMTEEEKKELRRLKDSFDFNCYAAGDYSFQVNLAMTEWLLKKHFDFMNLIPKGLAIEVTEENNPYET